MCVLAEVTSKCLKAEEWLHLESFVVISWCSPFLVFNLIILPHVSLVMSAFLLKPWPVTMYVSVC